jgi:phosphonate transport system substrate-binding protein
MGREVSIWDELNVIGVTEGIYNDTVAITKAVPEVYNDEFIAAMQDSLIEIIGTEEGHKIFDVYSHTGYAKATDSDYDGARKALEAVK